MKAYLRAVALGVAAVLFAASPGLGAEKLSRLERRLARHVDEHQAESLRLLERVVDINSGTLNFDGVRAVGAIFRAELDGLGFRTRWVDGAAFGRAGHLVGERPARDPRALRVLLIGHLDTVFERDSPFQRFERLPGNRARGPGVIDMKGGDVVMLTALAALRAAGALDRLSVEVVMSGDEEHAGEPLELARHDLAAAGAHAAVAIGFEDGDGRLEHAVVARRGASGWSLRVTGQAAHSSLVFRPEIGDGAIFELARILDAFRRELGGEAYLTFNPGLALGGTAVDLDPSGVRGTVAGKSNVVAATALAQGDLRTLSPEQLERARQRMREIVAQHLPHTTAEIRFEDGYRPMAPTEGNRALLAELDRASRDLDLGPVEATDPGEAGAADVSFVAGSVPRIIDGVGLKGSGGHTQQETADLGALPIQAKRIAVLLARLSGARR